MLDFTIETHRDRPLPMLRLHPWQWLVLILPIVAIVLFILIAAGTQIHAWGLSWIWAIVTVVLVGWRWLLVRWTRSQTDLIEAAIAQLNDELSDRTAPVISNSNEPEVNRSTQYDQALQALQTCLNQTQNDTPLWENWGQFGQRCQALVSTIAQIYHPEVKYPLLNIYLPQAYGLIRGTVDDLDLWMQKLGPALNQLTVAQALQGYETYRKLEPSARKLWQAWGWAQWVLNPATAIARTATRRYTRQANQQLLFNLSQLLREALLRQLAQRAIQLYSGTTLPPTFTPSPIQTLGGETRYAGLPTPQTQTLRDLLQQATPPDALDQQPINILIIGRTGAGKSSLINSLFTTHLAPVDVLPSTTQIQQYQWQHSSGATLTLWDTPGYEQVQAPHLRQQILNQAHQADLILLLSPALDPALIPDQTLLTDLRDRPPTSLSTNTPSTTPTPTAPPIISSAATIVLVTQVDRLRPLREWQPPYDWIWGDRPKEKAIREAIQYRAEQLADRCDRVLPIVNADPSQNREAWGIDAVATALVEAIAPAKQVRLARFLRDLDARAIAAAQIIDRYSLQMATTQGLTALLKSPVLQFLSTFTTGSPTLGTVLAAKIPAEHLPLVLGKLQMSYELFNLLSDTTSSDKNSPEKTVGDPLRGSPTVFFGDIQFDLLALWPLVMDTRSLPQRNAWALGQTLVEYWTQEPELAKSMNLKDRFNHYLNTDSWHP